MIDIRIVTLVVRQPVLLAGAEDLELRAEPLALLRRPKPHLVPLEMKRINRERLDMLARLIHGYDRQAWSNRSHTIQIVLERISEPGNDNRA